MVDLEYLKQNFITRDLKIYGKCICIPNKDFVPEWEKQLEKQGYKTFATFLDGSPFMLVRLEPPNPTSIKSADANKKRWSEDEDKKLIELWNAKLSIPEIVAKFPNRSEHSVKMRIGRLKIKGLIHSRWKRKTKEPTFPTESVETMPKVESAEIPQRVVNQMQIILVQFKDARSETQLWLDELEQIKLPDFMAVGFLIKETDEYIAIAQSFLPKTDAIDNTAYRNVLFIPKKVITKIQKVT